MGYTGACRREELLNMSLCDMEFKSDVIVVTVPKTKNNVARVFAVTNNTWINLIKKYAALRPKHITHQRFFLSHIARVSVYHLRLALTQLVKCLKL